MDLIVFLLACFIIGIAAGVVKFKVKEYFEDRRNKRRG